MVQRCITRELAVAGPNSPIVNRISEIGPFAPYVPGAVSGQILAGLFAATLSVLMSWLFRFLMLVLFAVLMCWPLRCAFG